MKKTGYTIGSLIILLICAFVFVILPTFTGASSKQGNALVFGNYDGKEIRYEQNSDFFNYASQYAQYYQSMGVQIDSQTHYYIMNQAFNMTVQKLTYQSAIKNSGYKAPKSAINREMTPYFYDENGKYSTKIYKQTNESRIREIQDIAETNLITLRFTDDNFGSTTDLVGSQALYGIKESNAELDFLANYSKESKGFEMARFPLSDYPKDEVLKYAQQNSAKFISYDLSAITVEEKSLANSVAKRIASNEITFEDAVSEHSEKNYTNSEGILTNKYQYQIENILTNKSDLAKISDLAVNAVSDVIETNGTFTIFKCNSEKVNPDFTEDSTYKLVASYITTYESTIVEDYFTAKAKELKLEAGKNTFEAAAKSAGAQFSRIDAFPLNYGSVTLAHSVDTSIQGLSNADTNETFLKTAFGLKLYDISEPIVLNNSIVLLKCTIEETNEVDATAITEIENYDTKAAQNAIMDSPKLTNNFAATYYSTYLK